MDDFTKWFGFALQILPMVLRGITLAEDTIGPGNGPAKKALVMSAFNVPAMADPAMAGTQAGVSKMIDSLVGPLTMAGKLQPHRPASAPGR